MAPGRQIPRQAQAARLWPPTISRAGARRKREDAKKLRRDGTDPSPTRKLERVAASLASANTFGAVAQEYMERLQGRGLAEITLTKKRWLLTDIAGPALSHRPITEISAFEILSVLQRVEKSGDAKLLGA